ncbi:MAG: hypothetical protein AAF219_07060 [Myxococcota bacterium]
MVAVKKGEVRVTFELSSDEAIVFFDWLARFNEKDDHTFEDQSEQRILWDLEAGLEKSLSAIVSSDYESRLADARSRVRDPEQ